MLKLALAMLLVGGAPALARPADSETRLVDENKPICRTTEIIGSRLGTKKTCMTRGQWDQYEREQRATIERVQSGKRSEG